jgi:hypothetical protein
LDFAALGRGEPKPAAHRSGRVDWPTWTTLHLSRALLAVPDLRG